MIFKAKYICSWKQFLEALEALDSTRKWIFRGQSSDKPLKTSIERALEDYGKDLEEAPGIERKLIRDFRRRYQGPNRDLVLRDTLYCLSLMRHHGAPTRLLDWTYSPYVAAFNALKEKISSEDTPVVWCINTDWCKREAEIIAGKSLIALRNIDEKRKDFSFKLLYMRDLYKLDYHQLIFVENPFLLNERLIIQKGVFLCPGDISKPFLKNIETLNDWNDIANIVKFKFNMTKEAHIDAIKELLSMNIGEESLFPGLDGFARSLKQKLLILNAIPDI